MFEEITDCDELQLAIALPELEFVPHGQLISLNSITESLALKSGFDAIFVGGFSDHLTVDERRRLSQICDDNDIELVQFENPSNDLAVISDVVVNLAGKLSSNEMPNNVSLTDIRNIKRYSDCFLAFNTMRSALEFLKKQSLGCVVSGVFLAYGNATLSEYEAAGDELLSYFAEEGFLCSSIYASGSSECTILLGMQYQGG